MLPPIDNMPTEVPPSRHHLSLGLLFRFESMLILPPKGVHVPGIGRCWILDGATPRGGLQSKTEPISRPLIPRRETMTGCKCFPFNNFKYYLTLSPEFFSPFPHGTCVLSVSCRYLALDGIYHPLGLQSRATRLYGTSTKDGTETRARYGIVTLSDTLFQRISSPCLPDDDAPQNYNSDGVTTRF
jgi:hypothetical protein